MSGCLETTHFDKVSIVSLFELLLALEKDSEDELDVLELVDGEKPLMALVGISKVSVILAAHM